MNTNTSQTPNEMPTMQEQMEAFKGLKEGKAVQYWHPRDCEWTDIDPTYKLAVTHIIRLKPEPKPKQKVFYQPGPCLLGGWVRFKALTSTISLIIKYYEDGIYFNNNTWYFEHDKAAFMDTLEYSLYKGVTWNPFYREE